MKDEDIRSGLVRIHYGPNSKDDYGYVVRFVESSPKKDTYVVATKAYPEGRYYLKNFLEWCPDNEAGFDYVKEHVIPYHEQSTWQHYIPENVDPYEFFCEMAEIYAGDEDGKRKNYKFHVCMFSSGEGPVPHVHVYYGKKAQDKDSHGNVLVSHICLGKNEYAPQHAEETKKLNAKERDELMDFFTSNVQKNQYGDTVKTPWEFAVRQWMIDHPDDWENHFKLDDDGMPIMPDYHKINMPSKRDIQRFREFGKERW